MSSAAEVADAWGIAPPPEEGAWVRLNHLLLCGPGSPSATPQADCASGARRRSRSPSSAPTCGDGWRGAGTRVWTACLSQSLRS